MILAATGHRPDKLGGYSPQLQARLVDLAAAYLREVRPEQAISGMALGWDMAVARAAAQLGVPFIAAVPFKGQESRWPPGQRADYWALMEQAARVQYTSPGGYAPWKFQVRNEWMVDNSAKLLALWDGSRGGTANCVKYAVKVGREVDNIWERWRA